MPVLPLPEMSGVRDEERGGAGGEAAGGQGGRGRPPQQFCTGKGVLL